MQLTVYLNRDSVHPGDDMESHTITIQIEAESTIGALLEKVKRSYLPGIAGGQSTWIITCSAITPNPLGVLAQQWREPKLRVPLETPVDTLLGTTRPSISFEYWCQKDPDLVFNRIAAGKEPPPKYSPNPLFKRDA